LKRSRDSWSAALSWAILVFGFACVTACIPSCNMAIQDRERPRPAPEPPPAQPAPPPAAPVERLPGTAP
jgi:hypothetical protein